MVSKTTPTQGVTEMLRLHASRSWPYANRVVIALKECGAPFEDIAIDLQNKPKEFCDLYAKANPIPSASAKVPLLEVIKEGEKQPSTILTESLVVTDYLAERFPDAGLLPSSIEDRACMRLFSELCGSSSFSYWNILRSKGDSEKFESAVKNFKQALIDANTVLEQKGDPEGPFLFGEQFTLAECNAAPFIQRACNVLPAFTGEGDGEAVVDPIKICEEQDLSRLKVWILAVLARPSVKAMELPEEAMRESTSKMLKRFAAMAKN